MSRYIWSYVSAARRRLGARVGVAAVLLLTPAVANAQAPETPPEAPPAEESKPAQPEATPDVAALAAELAEQKKELAAQRKALEEQKQALEESQQAVDDVAAKVDTAAAAGDSDWASRFKIYGFTDVGLNRVWANDDSIVAHTLNSSNATSFVIGNLNLYFDAQPVKGWRSLVEVRFTNAPHGEIASVGGLGGTFQRVSTQQYDPHAGSVAAPMWGGYTVIERAHLDWTDISWLKVRVGNFFTPFGIWNVDHGTPTLISVQLPGLIQTRIMPIRQTGIQVYGNTFAGDWELGYVATVSNGRQELSNFAFDDNRGFGGRVYANNEKGDLSMKFGASFYTGRVRDKQVDVVGINPLTFKSYSNYDFREIVGGVDASVDVGRTRIRAEAAFNRTQYDDGKHQVALTDPSQFLPNNVAKSGYVLMAHQLPFAPIEPYAMVDGSHLPAMGLGDAILTPSAGVNVRFTKATMWKTQFSHSFFFDMANGSDVSTHNASYLFSRLVLVF